MRAKVGLFQGDGGEAREVRCAGAMPVRVEAVRIDIMCRCQAEARGALVHPANEAGDPLRAACVARLRADATSDCGGGVVAGGEKQAIEERFEREVFPAAEAHARLADEIAWHDRDPFRRGGVFEGDERGHDFRERGGGGRLVARLREEGLTAADIKDDRAPRDDRRCGGDGRGQEQKDDQEQEGKDTGPAGTQQGCRAHGASPSGER